MQTSTSLTDAILPRQLHLCPALPRIIGCKDYSEFDRELTRIDGLLRTSKVEPLFLRLSVEQLRAETENAGHKLTVADIARHQEQSRLALRCEILRALLGQESYRNMSLRLSLSARERHFCGIGEIERVRIPSKSRLQTYTKWLPDKMMHEVLAQLLRGASTQAGSERMDLAAQIEFNLLLMDTTCLKANVHFPADWLLLRDAARTLTKATMLIRKRNICARMEAPESFLARMNKLSIGMAMAGRKVDSKRQKKAHLRAMKKLIDTIAAHARRHRAALDKHWAETDLPKNCGGYEHLEIVAVRIPPLVSRSLVGGNLDVPIWTCDEVAGNGGFKAKARFHLQREQVHFEIAVLRRRRRRWHRLLKIAVADAFLQNKQVVPG